MFHGFYTESSGTSDAQDDSQNRTEAAVGPHLQPNPSYCSIEMMKKTRPIAYENVIM